MTTYSHSRLETFQNCPAKYKFQYIDHKERGAKGVEAFVGSCVHDTLEKLYKDLHYCRTYTDEDLLALYDVIWKKNWTHDILVVRRDRTRDDYFNMGRKCVADYYRRYHPFDQGKTLATELKAYFCLDDQERYKVMGYIDRLDQRADGTYEIHDYKTSGSLPDENKLKRDRQLGLYQLGVRGKFSDTENIELVWHYVALDKEYRVSLDEARLSEIAAETMGLIDAVEAETQFAPNESNLCDWCDFPAHCPARKHLFAVEQLPPNEFLNEDGVVLVNKMDELKDKKKAAMDTLDAEIALVEEALVAYAEKQGVDVVRGSAKKAKIKICDTVCYPRAKTPERVELERLVEKAGRAHEICSFDSRKLGKAVDGGDWPDELVDQVKACAAVETKKSVTLSKLKDDELIDEESG